MVEQNGTGRHLVRQITLNMLIAMPILATACNRHSTPAGQTIATVDSGEITTSDLQLEMAGIPPGQRKQAQPRLVQTLVDRKVLAQYAASQNMDRSPDYVLQLRRLTETLLADRAAQQIAAGARQPISINEISQYLDAHPDIASNRRLLAIDQLTFPTPDAAVATELKPAKTLNDVIAVLQRHGIRAARNQTQIDTASLPDEFNAKLDHLQPGEPLTILNQPNSTSNVITGSKLMPLADVAAADVARQRINEQRVDTAIQQRGLALRNQAKITYAKGYAPTEAPITKP